MDANYTAYHPSHKRNIYDEVLLAAANADGRCQGCGRLLARRDEYRVGFREIADPAPCDLKRETFEAWMRRLKGDQPFRVVGAECCADTLVINWISGKDLGSHRRDRAA